MNTVGEAIQRASDILGSQAALARALNVEPAFVWQWLNEKRPVPPRYCAAVERLTEGKVTRRQLRPSDWEDFWPEDGRSETAEVSA